MANSTEDLDLLLSLGEERVLETPPASPSSIHPRLPDDDDDGSPKRQSFRPSDMSAFRDAVKDYIDTAPTSFDATAAAPPKSNKPKMSGEVDVEKYSGLRIKNQLISAVELNNRFSEIRFVRLPVIKNLIIGDTFSGCWATVGVLTEKGAPKMSSSGKSFCVWKMGCLDETNVSVFLFGDAYTKHSKEPVGSVFALFNSSARKDAVNGFSLSVYSASNISKIGTSADYGICKGKRKDGMACTMIINKRLGAYCKFHSSRSLQTRRYSTTRAELKGGNIRMPFRFQQEGIFMVDRLAERSNMRKPVQPVKVMSVDGLKKALSKAETVTTNSQSQGIRFLSQVTANVETKVASKASAKPNQTRNGTGRQSLAAKGPSTVARESTLPEAKRKKTDHASVNMIELDVVSSDEEG